MIEGLKGYPAYKESGVAWLGKVPVGWRVERLKHFVLINSGQVDPVDPIYRDMTLIAPNHVARETGRLLKAETALEQAANSGKYLVSKGQVIYSKIRPSLRKATIAPYNCLCSADMYPISPNERWLSSRFLLQYLLSEVFTQYAEDCSLRVAMPKLNRDALGRATLWLPSLEEQRAIVRFLDHLERRIHTYITARRRLIALLEEEKRAIIERAVTRGLDPNAPLKESGMARFGKVPTHWQITRLKNVVHSADGIRMGPFGASLKDLSSKNTGYKLYGQENTISGDFEKGSRWISSFQYDSLSRYALLPGDIVLTRKGSIGKCRIVPVGAQRGIADSDTIRVRPMDRVLLPQFLMLVLHSSTYIASQLELAQTGAILAGLNTASIANLRIAVPSAEQQQAIVLWVGDRCDELDGCVASLHRELDLLRAYRTRLVSDVATGKLDVREAAARLPDLPDESPLDDASDLDTDVPDDDTPPDPEDP